MIDVFLGGVEVASHMCCVTGAGLEPRSAACCAQIKYKFVNKLLYMLPNPWGRRQLSSSPEAKPTVGAVPTSAKPRSTRPGGMVGMAIDIGLDIGGTATTAVTDIGGKATTAVTDIGGKAMTAITELWHCGSIVTNLGTGTAVTAIMSRFQSKLQAVAGMHTIVAMSCWMQLHLIQSIQSAQALERAHEVFLRSLDITRIKRAWSVANRAYNEGNTLSSGLKPLGWHAVPWQFSFVKSELHFVAATESSDTSVLHLGFEGTKDKEGWTLDILGAASCDKWGMHGITVHAGFRAVADAMWKHVNDKYGPLKERYSRVHVTGHSLGGAIAVLIAMRLEDEGVPSHAVTFAQPKVTNIDGGRKYDASLDLTRVVFEDDPVPTLPWHLSHFQHALVVYEDGSLGVRPAFDTNQSRPGESPPTPKSDAGWILHEVTGGMCTTHPDLGLMAQCFTKLEHYARDYVDDADECKYMHWHAANSYALGVSRMVEKIYTPDIREKKDNIDALRKESAFLHNYTTNLGALMQTELLLQLDEVPLDVSLPRLYLDAFDQQVLTPGP